jgi:trk system potassium uptake protein TrkA
MNNKFAVIGLGDFGKNVALTLSKKNCEVIAIDKNIDIIEEIKDSVSLAVKTDATDEKSLLKLGIDQVDAAVIALGGDFEDTVLTCVILNQLNVKRIVARASTPIQEKILLKLGAHQVVTPEVEIAKKIANSLINDNILESLTLDENYNIFYIKAPKNFVGKSLQEIDLRIRYNVNLITLKRKYKETKLNGEIEIIEKIYGVPTAATVIEEDDTLIVFGKEKQVLKILD